MHERRQEMKNAPTSGTELHPKSFVSNFWGALQTAGATIFQCKVSDFSEDMQRLWQQISEDAQSQAEMQKIDENTILYQIDNRFLNPEKELPPINTWGKIGDRPALTRTGIILINAKPKQGKSFSVYALLSVLICGVKFDSLQPLSVPSRCIVFDTEMAEIDLQTRIKPLYQMIGEENRAKFQVCSLLSTQKSERLNVIMDIVGKYNPPIIAIDQVADLLNDFNNSVEAVDLFERLKVLMAERTVFLIIHQNKAKDDTNSKGHAGTLAEQNCSEYYTIKRQDGIFELTLKTARFASSDDATPFRFSLSDKGEIISCDDIAHENEKRRREGFCQNFKHLFGEDKELSYSNLVQRIIDVEGLLERAAKTKIKTALDAGSLFNKRRGKNTFYRLTPF